ncbi:uncharacterized protein CCOS01_00676 [Colletotrichum costaricense]|uniref:Uncharacterized protein n=1 Tax=Colletotrichum costaricense TaxID=1209916 RepID=A0AAI9ZBB5_9PEZI|nr:uncharacterized protein CCOS01_00676 [Colletotrichum costaricense]KAK1539362.1 hypothetical protein CCOS01_00676 [Colletotrichum costaricense]
MSSIIQPHDDYQTSDIARHEAHWRPPCLYVITTRLFLLRMTRPLWRQTRSTDIFQVQTLSMSDKSLPQAGIFPPATIARSHHARDAAQTVRTSDAYTHTVRGGQHSVIVMV